MSYELDLQNEQLTYTVQFSRPAFELWAQGAMMLKALYQALAPYGATLANFQLTPLTQSAAEPVCTVRVGQNGLYRLTLEKIELTFSQFSQEFFLGLPRIFSESTRWVREVVPGVTFSSHRFAYGSHSLLKSSTAEEFLRTVNGRPLKSAGTSLGNGVIYNFVVPNHNWVTQFVLDRSVVIKDALYLGFVLILQTDQLNYDSLIAESRYYLSSVLNELGLSLPELSQ
jgi:hypothetical protein